MSLITVADRIEKLNQERDSLMLELYSGDSDLFGKYRKRAEKRLSAVNAEIERLKALPDQTGHMQFDHRGHTLVEIPAGFCQCGCGSRAPIATRTHESRGWKKGQPLKYIRGHQPKVQLYLAGSHRISPYGLDKPDITSDAVTPYLSLSDVDRL